MSSNTSSENITPKNKYTGWANEIFPLRVFRIDANNKHLIICFLLYVFNEIKLHHNQMFIFHVWNSFWLFLHLQIF